MSRFDQSEKNLYQDKSSRQRSKSPIIKSYKGRGSNLNNQKIHTPEISRSFNNIQSTSTIKKQTSPLKLYDSAASVILRNKKQLSTKQKQDFNKNQKLFTKTIFYQNNISQLDSNFRVESFYKDGSSISWKGQSLVNLSSKAIKTRVNLRDICRSEELSFKFIQIVKMMNQYNDNFYILETKIKQKIYGTLKNSLLYKGRQPQKDTKNDKVYKKYKIEEYYWQKCRIDETQKGFLIQSNDQNATMILNHDLFRIKVTFLQFTNVRKIQNSRQIEQSDQENDSVLDKYTFHPPVQLSQNNKKSEKSQVWYEYVRVIKQFSIFNLPEKWFYPIDQIWTYLLANKIIKHEFIYIDFFEQNILLRKSTKMPPIVTIGQKSNQKQANQNNSLIRDNLSLPLYGKPTHEDKCRWISFCFEQENTKNRQERIMWLNSESEENIFFDGYGFWKSSSDGISVLYKKKNCFDTLTKYNFNAVPLTIRVNQQPQRCLQSALGVFYSYIQHNKKLQYNDVIKQQKELFQTQTNNIGKDSQQIMFDENVPDIGYFKVYGNNTIIGKFIDRIMLTLKGDMVTIIDDVGQTIIISLNKKQQYSDKNFGSNIRNPYVRFREHIKYITDFYQRCFHYEEWIKKQQLIQGLDHLRIANEAFINVCQKMKKN